MANVMDNYIILDSLWYMYKINISKNKTIKEERIVFTMIGPNGSLKREINSIFYYGPNGPLRWAFRLL